jgi:multimeric flavodoxin WrbA
VVNQRDGTATLLHLHHTTSPSVHAMFDAVQSGATDPQIVGVDVVTRAALHATVADVLAADGYLLGTPANLGYMSGALKHFFDQIYYPCLEAPSGAPSACTCTGTTTRPARCAPSRSSRPGSGGVRSRRRCR